MFKKKKFYVVIWKRSRNEDGLSTEPIVTNYLKKNNARDYMKRLISGLINSLNGTIERNGGEVTIKSENYTDIISVEIKEFDD